MPGPTNPTLPDPNADAKAAEALKKACDEAYITYPNSCSHAVWDIVTKIADPKFKLQDANMLIDFWISSAEWVDVTLDKGWLLANQGAVVCGGLKNPGGHGHVIAIYPGDKMASGGYTYTYKNKKTSLPVQEKMRSHGIYPRALSTSIGTWPGAMSKGDKTVWDPWANDDVFTGVKYWTRK
jgi:hypothetical protein